jgi:hypothetical protein
VGVPAGAWQRRLLMRGRHCFCRCCTSMRTGEHPAGKGKVQYSCGPGHSMQAASAERRQKSTRASADERRRRPLLLPAC